MQIFDENETRQLKSLAYVAKSEMQTIEDYIGLDVPEEDREKLAEIIGDELNHALITIFAFARKSGIKIPSDGIFAFARKSGIKIPSDGLEELMTEEVFKEEG